MSRRVIAPSPTYGPFYLISPTGRTVKLVGPGARALLYYHVVELDFRICTHREWQAARRKQRKGAT